MGAPDGSMFDRSAWPIGVDNVKPEKYVRSTALREAVNVDLDDDGRARRRRGYTLRLSGRLHSAAAVNGSLYAVRNGDLVEVSPSYAATTIRAGVGERPLTYAAVGERVVWSNGAVIRGIDDGVDTPIWPATPVQPTVAPRSTGGLHAGVYQVALTFVDAAGREGGSTLAVEVDVPAGGGITLTDIPYDADAPKVRVYVTEANSETLYFAAELFAGASTWLLGSGTRGKALDSQFMQPLPPADILRAFAGRLVFSSGNVFSWSDVYRHGLYNPAKYIAHRGRITMIEPVADHDGNGTGLFVASGVNEADKPRTYFVSDTNPMKWTNAVAYPYGVVPGSSSLVPASLLELEGSSYAGLVPMWLATNGVFCAGLPGGVVLPITERTFVAPQNAVSAAALLRVRDGMNHLLMTVQGGEPNIMRASDEAVATIRKRGVSLS